MKEYGAKLLSRVVDFLPSLAAALVLFCAGYVLMRLLLKLTDRALARSRLDVSLHAFIRTSVKVTLLALLILICATALGIPTASLIAAFGAVGLAVSLALKDSLSNLASGLLLLATHPFRVGDMIEIEGETGTVQEINFFYTTLITFDNKQIHLPNSKVSAAQIINITAADARRLDLTFPIRYSDDVELAKSLILAEIEKSDAALSTPAPVVRVNAYGDSAIEIVAKVWVKNDDHDDYYNLRFDLLEQVKKAFDASGISIPYPQMDVHVKPDLPQQ